MLKPTLTQLCTGAVCAALLLVSGQAQANGQAQSPMMQLLSDVMEQGHRTDRTAQKVITFGQPAQTGGAAAVVQQQQRPRVAGASNYQRTLGHTASQHRNIMGTQSMRIHGDEFTARPRHVPSAAYGQQASRRADPAQQILTLE
ncbi:MAG: hypothetical protein Alpg2KO_24370 [Alphaproteobacteria bacterium]